MYKLSTLLNDHWIKEEIKRKIRKYFDEWQWRHKIPKLWDAAKMVLGEKYIAVNAYMKKEEISQMNNLIFPVHTLKKRTANWTKRNQKERNNNE